MRKTIILTILTGLLVFGASLAPVATPVTPATLSTIASSPAPPALQSCGSLCVQALNACKASCGGNAACLAQCQSEYQCCQIQCHGGSCRQGATGGNRAGKPVGGRMVPVNLLVATAATAVPVTASRATSPCTDDCYADYQARRYTCTHSGLPPQQAIACINQAQAELEECLGNC